jgi:hypothetical protein
MHVMIIIRTKGGEPITEEASVGKYDGFYAK